VVTQSVKKPIRPREAAHTHGAGKAQDPIEILSPSPTASSESKGSEPSESVSEVSRVGPSIVTGSGPGQARLVPSVVIVRRKSSRHLSQKSQKDQEPKGKQMKVEEVPLEQAAQEFAEGDCLVNQGNHLLSRGAIHRARRDAILQKYHTSLLRFLAF
jgi:hypothetical protein